MAEFGRYAESYRDAVQESMPPGVDSELFTRIKADRLVRVAERLLGDPRELQAIDVGCGAGETDRFLLDAFGELHGVDIAPELVEVAARRYPSVSYRASDAGEPLPHDDDSFDLAFAICVLHHVPPVQWSSFAAELARVVRPGGVVAVFEHNPRNPLTRRAVARCEFDEDAVLLKRGELISLLSGQSLEIVESPYIAFFPSDGRRLQAIDRRLGSIPLGAQYYVAARKARASDTAAAA